MRTSELARRVGVKAETLRYYERRGLLDAPPRTASGYRDYPPSAVDMLRFIKRAQELGFTLEQVEVLVHLDDGGPDSCDAARALAKAHQADLEARITDLQQMRISLGELIATCDLPRGTWLFVHWCKNQVQGQRSYSWQDPAQDSEIHRPGSSGGLCATVSLRAQFPRLCLFGLYIRADGASCTSCGIQDAA
jgi:MerR family transcriptional regulator, mercuric resistance operon regulatory protein